MVLVQRQKSKYLNKYVCKLCQIWYLGFLFIHYYYSVYLCNTCFEHYIPYLVTLSYIYIYIYIYIYLVTWTLHICPFCPKSVQVVEWVIWPWNEFKKPPYVSQTLSDLCRTIFGGANDRMTYTMTNHIYLYELKKFNDAKSPTRSSSCVCISM